MSWTPHEDVEKRDQEIALVDKVLNAQLALNDSPLAGLTEGLAKAPSQVDETEKSQQNSGAASTD